jgi:hypothetical protein
MDALKGAPFRPETSWRKAASMYDAGRKSGLQPSKRLDDRAQPMFGFSSLQEFRRPMEQPLTLPKRTVETLSKNSSLGVAASSYQLHFLDAVCDANRELLSGQVDPAKMIAIAERQALFLKQVTQASCYVSAFHVFSDAQFTLARRDQYVAKLKPYLKHHATALRSGPFDTPELFPNLGEILPDVQSDTHHQSVAVLADHLVPGRGKSQSQSRQQYRRRDTDSFSRSGRSRARSRSADRSSPRSGRGGGRGSRGFGRGQYHNFVPDQDRGYNSSYNSGRSRNDGRKRYRKRNRGGDNRQGRDKSKDKST